VEPVVALYAERNRVALRAVRELRSEHSTIGRTQRRA
jgi:hypothetical protein